MKPDIHDMLVLIGFVSLVAGVALMFAPSAAAIVGGVLFMVAGILSGAASRKQRKASDQATPQGQATDGHR